ncbi:hypothetical protein FIBSPDRAFT_876825 [Athelia psychrophila]|uniref:Uncharacterized protein n=1 Tax=Athelia psychrophila TaxID=1759441 RepID=A0A167WGS0_9AGAM|nr:hypothetical protein FIBSPDRAFT_876825 [Fibularhizoctonia sp. CBS 109695]
MDPVTSFSTNAPNTNGGMDVCNVVGSHTTYNYNGPVHYHSYCSIHGCPNHTPITTPNSVTPDPLAGVGEDTAELPVSDGRAVSSSGISVMEAPIDITGPPTPLRRAGRIIANANLILTRLIRALSFRKATHSRRSA